MKVRLHALEPASRANGPGLRVVVWFQGCTIGCPGCFNPATHSSAGGYEADTADLVEVIGANRREIDGLSISGGEPFQQPEALLDLLTRVQAMDLGVLVFSGYPIAAIEAQPLGSTILGRIDALIAGPYVTGRHSSRALLGSSNQRVHLLTPRYSHRDFEIVPTTEAVLHRDGTMTLSGIHPLHLVRPSSRS